MGKYYCDYCDVRLPSLLFPPLKLADLRSVFPGEQVFLTHDSASGSSCFPSLAISVL